MTTSLPTIEIIDGPDLTTDAEGWKHYAYTLRISFAGDTLETPWRQGIGIVDDPSIGPVMSSLISDAQGIEGSTGFPDWAESYGLNPDSIKDREMYLAAKAQTDALAQVIGRSVLVALMDDDDSTYGSDERFMAAWERATA